MRARCGLGLGLGLGVGPAFVAAAKAAAVLLCGFSAPTASGAVPPYSLVGSFQLPLGTSVFDVAPDGRIVALSGNEVHYQDGPGAPGFTRLGSVPGGLINSFGASFLRVSPDGGRIAIGDGNFGPNARVLFIQTDTLNPGADSPYTAADSPNYDAAWADNGTLFVTGAAFSFGSLVNRIDSGTLTSTTVLTGVGDGSGGVALHGGRAFIGVGFDLDPGTGIETGDIRAFDLPTLLSTTTALDFSASGLHAARALSGGFLSFDDVGSLLVGGGDFFGENGFAAVIDPDAVAAALAGGPFATSADALTLAPAGSQYYSTAFNPVTGEVLIRAFGESTVYRYAVPAPSVVMIALFGGVFAHRRRRA